VIDDEVGLFGPGSVTWRVHADPMFAVAGLRALILQALHPIAMQAVDAHSLYHEDVWGRLTRTAEYVAVTTYGTVGEALTAAARVRSVHSQVTGRTADGRPYAADDPALLAWVHCCLVDSFLTLPLRSGLALTGAEQDAYVREQVASAVLMGLEPDAVPRNRAELADYFTRVRPELACTPAARRAVAVVIAPPLPPAVALATPARPAWASVAGLAFAALPGWARRIYAIPELPGAAGLTDAATNLGLHTLRGALRGVQAVVPPLREGPHRKAARLRLSQ